MKRSHQVIGAILFLSLIICALTIGGLRALYKREIGSENAVCAVDCQRLRNLNIEWHEKGEPKGGELTVFIDSFGYRKLIVEDRMLQVGTSNFYVLASIREPSYCYVNKIFLCTNGSIIAESPTGVRTIVTRSESGAQGASPEGTKQPSATSDQRPER